MTHHPKGSMCAACKYRNVDCSDLDFESMPVTKKYQDSGKTRFVVICSEFSRESD